jgi:hypothetical protein
VQSCNTPRCPAVWLGVPGSLSVQKRFEALVGQRAWLGFYLQYFSKAFRLESLDLAFRENWSRQNLAQQSQSSIESFRHYGDLYEGAVPVGT